MTKQKIEIDPKLPFQLLSVEDCGETNCPHCGAEGRYIYVWAEFGVTKSAMAGCYKMLTGKLPRNAIQKYTERVYEKQAHNKPLNGWDKTVLRMLDYASVNAGDAGKVNWAYGKIHEAIKASQKYRVNKF